MNTELNKSNKTASGALPRLVVSLRAAIWCVCHLNYGLTYQKCRFCGAGWPKLDGLWKYAVRHYICTECRDKKLSKLREVA